MNNTPPYANRHTRDLRKGRFSETDRTYLLTTVIHQRRAIFSEWQVARLLVNELRIAEELGLARSLAWVVMPDHLHWLVTLQAGDLSELVQRIKSRSAIAINRALLSHGKIWQKGFHDHALRNDEDMQTVARYIVANPLRAGLVEKIGDYPLWDAVWL